MTDIERIERLNNLYNSQTAVCDGLDILSNYEPSKYVLSTNYETTNIELPVFEEISNIEKLDDEVFAKWKATDLPVLVVAGGLGTLSSVLLRDFFANLHDDWGSTLTSTGGHSGENIDWVPGAKQPGGFGHRWKYGHDLLNPFEVDWNQYSDLAKQGGGIIPSWLKAPFLWMRHLLQDTFSKEGLPIPGNSLLRYFLNPADPKTREILQILGTIKMRDIAGAGITNLVIGAYVWGTEKDIKKAICKPNYRGYSLMLGANLVTLLSGLLVPPPATSFNWGTIPVICYYSYQLIKLEKSLREQLLIRESILDENFLKLERNRRSLEKVSLMNDECYQEFMKYETDIIDFYNYTINKHETLKNHIMNKGV
jgi:hypothetical protein